MSLFTSDWERRLWIWTLAVMVAIYSTMGPAQALAQALRERNLLRISVFIALLLGGVFIAWRWARKRPGWREVAVAIGVSFAYLWVLARVASPEERTHLIEYAVVASFIYGALMERRRNGRRVSVPAALALLVTVLLGWLDEAIQVLHPNRVYDVRDVAFNTLAALMAISASLALGRARRRDTAEDP